MSHELIHNIATLNPSWHGLDNIMQPGMSIEQWAEKSGLNFEAIKVPAIAAFPDQFEKVPDRFFIARKDTKHILSPGTVSDIYRLVQPKEVLDWFGCYILNDPRFVLETAGALRHGDTIWASARFNGDDTVAGEKVRNRLLMSTTFDGTGATLNKPVSTCVVCNNTFQAALMEPQSAIKTRHNTKFDGEKVAKDLAKVASGFTKFKQMGDALAQAPMTRKDVVGFFRDLLDIKPNATKDEVSNRKLNIFDDLSRAYSQTATERNRSVDDRGDAWLALNAVTRYVDHDRTVRNVSDFAGGELEARFASAQFGSGAQLKAKAWDLLMPRVRDKVLIAA